MCDANVSQSPFPFIAWLFFDSSSHVWSICVMPMSVSHHFPSSLDSSLMGVMEVGASHVCDLYVWRQCQSPFSLQGLILPCSGGRRGSWRWTPAWSRCTFRPISARSGSTVAPLAWNLSSKRWWGMLGICLFCNDNCFKVFMERKILSVF